LFSSYSPVDTVAVPLQGPSSEHLLGTDSLGRDVLVRVFAAGRLDLALAALGVAATWSVGTLVGIGVVILRRRWLDSVLERIIDSLLAFPFILFSLTLVLVFGADWAIGPLPAGAPATLLAIWFINWTLYARLAKTETRSLIDSDFVVAARLLGYSSVRIVLRHLLPSVTRTTGTVAAGDALLVVAVIAALPFLGAGIQPPSAEWGAMMYEGRSFLSQAPLLILAPAAMMLWFGVGLTLTVDRQFAAASARTEAAGDVPAPPAPTPEDASRG
jgi:peptide/nickel transport system permease protein